MSTLLLMLFSCQVLAKTEADPEIKDIIITTSHADLLAFASVKNAFSPAMLADLHKGQPIIFTYHLELVKVGTWFDSTLNKFTVTHTLQYNADTKQYLIDFSEKNKSQKTADLEEAKRLMSEINGVNIIALSELAVDTPYAIHFKVTLQKGSLPLGLHHLLPISALWDTETDWRTIEFRY